MSRNRKLQNIRQSMDAGTIEMSRRFTIVPKLAGPNTLTMKVMDGDEIDRMLLKDAINPMQHATLQTLGKRLHRYGMVGLRSPDYASPPSHLDPEQVSERKATLIRGAVKLISSMDDHQTIGRVNREALINLVLHGSPWGRGDLHACILALDDIFLKRKTHV